MHLPYALCFPRPQTSERPQGIAQDGGDGPARLVDCRKDVIELWAIKQLLKSRDKLLEQPCRVLHHLLCRRNGVSRLHCSPLAVH